MFNTNNSKTNISRALTSRKPDKNIAYILARHHKKVTEIYYRYYISITIPSAVRNKHTLKMMNTMFLIMALFSDQLT